eukprot:228559-Pelagomonas_calceolata.AAC.3
MVTLLTVPQLCRKHVKKHVTAARAVLAGLNFRACSESVRMSTPTSVPKLCRKHLTPANSVWLRCELKGCSEPGCSAAGKAVAIQGVGGNGDRTMSMQQGTQ